MLLGITLLLVSCRQIPLDGKWQREGEPSEFITFYDDGNFEAVTFMEEGIIEGNYKVVGKTIELSSSYGHTAIMKRVKNKLELDNFYYLKIE
jgi:hypothetical protein